MVPGAELINTLPDWYRSSYNADESTKWIIDCHMIDDNELTRRTISRHAWRSVCF